VTAPEAPMSIEFGGFFCSNCAALIFALCLEILAIYCHFFYQVKGGMSSSTT
jgi:hypothetical protein